LSEWSTTPNDIFAQDFAMNADQFEQTIETLLERRPFRKFTVELSQGDPVEIDQPRMIAMRDGTAACFTSGGRPFWFRYSDVTRIRSDN
jgi:hypothetical protein